MKKSGKISHAHAVSRSEGVKRLAASKDVLCVDTANCAPPEMARFSVFNPFHFDHMAVIPVPGQNEFACSIESIWQGLKIIDGQTDFAMFKRVPSKRPSDSMRQRMDYVYEETKFLFGKFVIDLISARFVIYLPTYLYVLENLVSTAIIEEIFDTLQCGCDVIFYDWDDNHDITDPSSSFSHSAILAAWCNGTLDETLLRPARQLIQFRPEFGPESIFDVSMQRYRRCHVI